MKKKITLILLTMAMLLCLSACAQSIDISGMQGDLNEILDKLEPIPTATPTPVPTVKPTITPKPTATPSPSPKATESPEPEESPMPSESPAVTASPSPSPTATATLKPSPTPTPTPKPTVKPTATPEPTYTPYPESMMAPAPGLVPYGTPKPSPTPTPAPTPAPVQEVEQAPAEEEAPAEEAPAATPEPTPKPVPTRNPASGSGQDIADFACQFVGYSYVYGAESPDEGFDCSGLVYYVYQQFGYTLNRTAAAQASNGVHVELDAIVPGDILCFYNQGSYIGHCGIYIGGGNYVHARDSASGVVISPLSERTCRIEARRILD